MIWRLSPTLLQFTRRRFHAQHMLLDMPCAQLLMGRFQHDTTREGKTVTRRDFRVAAIASDTRFLVFSVNYWRLSREAFLALNENSAHNISSSSHFYSNAN